MEVVTKLSQSDVRDRMCTSNIDQTSFITYFFHIVVYCEGGNFLVTHADIYIYIYMYISDYIGMQILAFGYGLEAGL